MGEMTPRFPQLLRGLGLWAPALATKMPVKLVKPLLCVGFQGKETCWETCLPKGTKECSASSASG